MSFIEMEQTISCQQTEIEDLKAANAALEAEVLRLRDQWQPIETAPEGERFLTATKLSDGSYGQVGISHKFYCYAVNARGWAIAGNDPHATHWMPLPKAPNGASS